MTPVRLEPAAPRSPVKHSSTEPLTPQIQPGLTKRQVPMATIIFNVRKSPVGIGGGVIIVKIPGGSRVMLKGHRLGLIIIV